MMEATKCAVCARDSGVYKLCGDCREHFGYTAAGGVLVPLPALALTHSQVSVRERCLECGGLKREHRRVKGKGWKCPTRLKESTYTPWSTVLDGMEVGA